MRSSALCAFHSTFTFIPRTHRSGPGRSSPAASPNATLANIVPELLFALPASHFVISRTRTRDLLNPWLADTLVNFDRWRNDRPLDTGVVAASAVVRTLPGLERFARIKGTERGHYDNPPFLKEYSAYAEQHTLEYRRSLADLGISSANSLARTTSEQHAATRADIWKALVSGNHVFRGHYDGWFAWDSESFLGTDGGLQEILLDAGGPNSGLVTAKAAAKDGRKATNRGPKVLTTATGTAVWKTKQASFIFRLAKYRERIVRWLLDNEDAIIPKSAHASLLSHLSTPTSLPDIPLTIPRSRFPAGPPVPQDPKHAFSPPFDALCGYITASQGKHWPPDLFILPAEALEPQYATLLALLMALDLPLPKQVWATPLINSSRGDGNVDARDFISRAGKNATRWYLATGIDYSAASIDGNGVELSHAGLVQAYEKLRESVNGLLLELELLSGQGELLPLEQGYAVAGDARLESQTADLPFKFARLLLLDHDPRVASLACTELLDSTVLYLQSARSKASSSAPERRTVLFHLATEALRTSCTLLDVSILPGFFDNVLKGLEVDEEQRSWEGVTSKRVGEVRVDEGKVKGMWVQELKEEIEWEEDVEEEGKM